MKKFCFIAVDYENWVPREGNPSILTGLESLKNQTFRDFDVIICHDGPKNIPYEDEYDFSVFQNVPVFMNTETRMNDWGHSSRDIAMRRASGEYFIHFNIDNIFYPQAFQRINDYLQIISEQIIIFQVKHYKAAGGAIFTGLPPIHCHIDAMQLVAHRDIWQNVGYWYDKSGTSDGIIYEDMCKKYPYGVLPECLGENF